LLVPSPAEAHWQRGKIERRISFFKDLMVRVIYELGIETDEDERLIWQAVTQVTQTLNTHIFESDYCPYQSVFGRMPRQVTSLISSPGVLGAHDAISNDATAANAEACRAAALKAFYELDCSKAIRESMTHGRVGGSKRPIKPGDVVYFWRDSKTGTQSKTSQRLTGWQGPAIVLFRLGTSSFWVSYGFTIMLVAPEQCRHASQDEVSGAEVMEEFLSSVDERFSKRLRGQMTFMDARNGERYLERIDARVRQPTVDPYLSRHPMAPGPSAPTTGGGGTGVQAGGFTADDDRPPGRGTRRSADPSTEAASPGEAAYTPMSRIRQRTDDAGKRVRRNDPDLQEVPLRSPVPHVPDSPLAPAMGATSPIWPQQMFPSPIHPSATEFAIDTPPV
jgi:hypothetical protein